MKIAEYRSAFDRLCADVERGCWIVKQKYTYRRFTTDYPSFCFVLRRPNDVQYKDSLDGWQLYAVRTDSGEWKQIVLLDVHY